MTRRIAPPFRPLAAALVALVVLLAACGDDDSAGEPTPTTAPPTDLGGSDGSTSSGGDGGGGNPISDDVTVEISGAFDQVFRGGACFVDEGFLQIVAGFATGIGPNRPQASPYANGTVFLIAPAEEGELDTGAILNVVRESDSEFILAETPALSVDPGLLTGTFESDMVSGSWSCPAVLTAEQLQDLQADYIG
jgi:hypothetical protein